MKNKKEINSIIEKLSSNINYNFHEAAIILAAGHGKRIKSQKSKMLHKIWGIPKNDTRNVQGPEEAP